MPKHRKPIVVLFYCQHTPQSGEQDKQALEGAYGKSLRLFSIPCSGRIEPLHLLRALEEFADAAYVIACPKGACRYAEGNVRAIKRVQRARELIESIGLEGERLGFITGSKENPKSLADHASEIMALINTVGPSPVSKMGRTDLEEVRITN
jgi:F420-non-reducing hydrogenase iron-sulfur subunit